MVDMLGDDILLCDVVDRTRATGRNIKSVAKEVTGANPANPSPAELPVSLLPHILDLLSLQSIQRSSMESIPPTSRQFSSSLSRPCHESALTHVGISRWLHLRSQRLGNATALRHADLYGKPLRQPPWSPCSLYAPAALASSDALPQ